MCKRSAGRPDRGQLMTYQRTGLVNNGPLLTWNVANSNMRQPIQHDLAGEKLGPRPTLGCYALGGEDAQLADGAQHINEH